MSVDTDNDYEVEAPAVQADTAAHAPLWGLLVPMLDAATVKVAQGQQPMMARLMEYLHSQQPPRGRLGQMRVLEVHVAPMYEMNQAKLTNMYVYISEVYRCASSLAVGGAHDQR